MIRFMVTINDVAWAMPFLDFATPEACRAAAENMAWVLTGINGVESFVIKCVERADINQVWHMETLGRAL